MGVMQTVANVISTFYLGISIPYNNNNNNIKCFIFLQGIDFTTFSLHMGGGLVFIFIAVNLHLRFIFRNMQDLKFTEPSNVTGIQNNFIKYFIFAIV